MNQYILATKQAGERIGRRLMLLISEGPDDVIDTWQPVTVDDAEIHRDPSGFYVTDVVYRGRLNDGRLVYGSE